MTTWTVASVGLVSSADRQTSRVCAALLGPGFRDFSRTTGNETRFLAPASSRWEPAVTTETIHEPHFMGIEDAKLYNKLHPSPPPTATECQAELEGYSGENYLITIHGSGLQYDVDNENIIGGTVTSFDIGNDSGTVYVTFSGFSSVDAVEFFTALKNDDTSSTDGRYQYLVSLLDDDTTVTGSSGDEHIEVGAGNDTVNGFGGDDVVFKWKSGDLTFDGGGGSDTVVFQAATGDINPPTWDRQLVVDLGAGTGVNPFGGGALHLSNVENVIGTDHADHITGDGKANIIGDGIYDTGADHINGKGGNDTVNLAETYGNPGGVNANGGSGTDTLAVNFGGFADDGPVHKLDLKDQSKNSGVFTNDVFTNFEKFVHGTGYWAPSGQTFVFIDTNDGHTVEAMGETNKLTLNGGNDTVILSTAPTNYVVDADGGSGKDTLQFEVFSKNNQDTTGLTSSIPPRTAASLPAAPSRTSRCSRTSKRTAGRPDPEVHLHRRRQGPDGDRVRGHRRLEGRRWRRHAERRRE